MYNTHTNRLLNGKIPCLLRQWFLILFYTENTYTSREMITALTSVRTKKCSKNQKLTKIAPFFPPNFFPLPNWWFQAQREKIRTFLFIQQKKYPSPRCHLQINKENSAKSHFCDVCVIIWLLFFLLYFLLFKSSYESLLENYVLLIFYAFSVLQAFPIWSAW